MGESALCTAVHKSTNRQMVAQGHARAVQPRECVSVVYKTRSSMHGVHA